MESDGEEVHPIPCRWASAECTHPVGLFFTEMYFLDTNRREPGCWVIWEMLLHSKDLQELVDRFLQETVSLEPDSYRRIFRQLAFLYES